MCSCRLAVGYFLIVNWLNTFTGMDTRFLCILRLEIVQYLELWWIRITPKRYTVSSIYQQGKPKKQTMILSLPKQLGLPYHIFLPSTDFYLCLSPCWNVSAMLALPDKYLLLRTVPSWVMAECLMVSAAHCSVTGSLGLSGWMTGFTDGWRAW